MSDKLYGPLIDVAQALSRLATAHERVASMAEENRGYKPSGDAGPPINIAAGVAHRQRFAAEEELKIATSKIETLEMALDELRAENKRLRGPCEADYKCIPGRKCRMHL